MNCQVDIVIIGDSKDGQAALKKIASANPAIKVAFISREFKSTTTRDFLNVEYIKEEVIFTDYKNRLFGCYLKNGDRIYCTHLIIASGLSYAPFMVGNKQVPGVFNTVNEIPKTAKQQVAVVIGSQIADTKLALAVAKKYKYVYLCTESTEIVVNESMDKKLDSTENLLILKNASIAKATFEEDTLVSITLDNYAKITCNAIFARTTVAPETAFVSDKLISKEEGYLKTTNTCQSLLVPRCFAVGSCSAKCTQQMVRSMIETVLNDFNRKV